MMSGVRILFWAALLLCGCYFELGSAVVSAGLIALLMYSILKKRLRFRVNDALIASAGIFIFNLLSFFWAEDRGMALWGAVKYLPLPLFLLAIFQYDAEERSKLINDIPYIGMIMTVLSFVLQFIPSLKSQFIINGRLGGLFLYPNTYAVFCLTGLLILLMEKEPVGNKALMQKACMVIVAAGLALSGSRSAIALATVFLPGSLIYSYLDARKGREESRSLFIRFGLLTGLAVTGLVIGFLAASLLGLASGTHITQGTSDTFFGRIQYMKDVLPQILKNPLGYGYLSYYFMQGSFQNGYYTVRWVHNDLLQLLFDAGWIPAFLLLTAVIKSFFSRNISPMHRVVILVLCLHALMDFDMSFAGMYLLLFLFLDIDSDLGSAGSGGKRKTAAALQIRSIDFKKKPVGRVICLLCAAVFTLGSLYIGIVSSLTYAGENETAFKLYPRNTLAEASLLSESETDEEIEKYSLDILDRNPHLTVAYQGAAAAAFSQGRILEYLDHMKKAIEHDRYNESLCSDMESKLQWLQETYLSSGDAESVQRIESELKWLSDFRENRE